MRRHRSQHFRSRKDRIGPHFNQNTSGTLGVGISLIGFLDGRGGVGQHERELEPKRGIRLQLLERDLAIEFRIFSPIDFADAPARVQNDPSISVFGRRRQRPQEAGYGCDVVRGFGPILGRILGKTGVDGLLEHRDPQAPSGTGTRKP
jgi:hypothetical protein